jgi:hypothetical protein
MTQARQKTLSKDADSIEAQVAAMQSLGRDALRERWRQQEQSEPPAHLSRWLLFRILAYRLQVRAFGDLDRESAVYLERIADAVEQRRAGVSIVTSSPNRRLKPGTILVREHGRVMHRVAVTETGYAWNGKTYESLSQVAYAITGTRWNGPRFFGLRDKKPDAPVRKRNGRQSSS